ncbi:MAG: hypothetical protein ACRDJ9_15315, partial [Dehalococcoidia bacterium]
MLGLEGAPLFTEFGAERRAGRAEPIEDLLTLASGADIGHVLVSKATEHHRLSLGAGHPTLDERV